jgi:N-acetylneuraminic acid mutarotase
MALLEENRWTHLKTQVGSIQPTPRSGHCCSIVGGKLYVFGGIGDTEAFNDLHSFDIVEKVSIDLQLRSGARSTNMTAREIYLAVTHINIFIARASATMEGLVE